MTNKEYLEVVVRIMKFLMNYGEDQKLSKFMILRLQGIPNGKTVANNKTKASAKYSYETIIKTFKLFKYDIDNTLSRVQIVDDNHKFNLILSVIDKHLNDTVKIEQKQKEAEELTKNMNIDSLVHEQVDYQSNEEKVNESIKEELEDLW